MVPVMLFLTILVTFRFFCSFNCAASQHSVMASRVTAVRSSKSTVFMEVSIRSEATYCSSREKNKGGWVCKVGVCARVWGYFPMFCGKEKVGYDVPKHPRKMPRGGKRGKISDGGRGTDGEVKAEEL